MTNPVIRSSQSKISRFLLTSGLFLFGTCLLNSGSANAWVANAHGTGFKCAIIPAVNPPINTSCQMGLESPLVGDKAITVLGFTTKLGALDTLEFSTQAFDPSTPWHVDLNFIPNRGPGESGFLKYKLAIADASQFFSYVKLSNASGITNHQYIIQKEFYSDDSFSPAALLPSWTLSNPPSPVGEAILQSQTLYVMDSWNIHSDADGSLNNINNSYRQSSISVPGPLPLLGVVAGLGHSRRLRKRILASLLT